MRCWSLGSVLALGLAWSPSVRAQDDALPPVEAESAVEPAPHPWNLRHAELNELARQGDLDLLFFGDSISHGWERLGTSAFAEFYSQRKAANFAIDGDRTQNILWRMQNGNLDGITPKVVVLQTGLGNLFGGNSPKETAEGVRVILDELALRTPETRVLLLAVFPFLSAKDNPYRGKMHKLNERLSALADGERVVFLDLASTFADDNGNVYIELLPDYIHPNEDGYRAWARAMEPTLARLMGDTPVLEGVGANDPSLSLEEDPAIVALDAFIAQRKLDLEAGTSKSKLPRPPQVTFNLAKHYEWVLKTSEGTIRVRLMPDVAPMHVSSTLYLTRLGFYDGLSFHRVIPGYIAQTGCPLGTGVGTAGYNYASEVSPTVKHDAAGVLAMANTGQPNSDGSQVFLTFAPMPQLDGNYTILGRVVDGLETLAAIEKFGTRNGRTTKPVTLESATIELVNR